MSRRTLHATLACAALLALALVLVVTVNSLGWIGRSFPGFMIMANRVVASIALPHWADGRAPELFQHEIVTLDGAPVSTADEVHERVASEAPGTPIAYRLRSPVGASSSVVVPVQRFTYADYALLFGAYLFNGVVFLTIGLLAFALKPDQPASRALLVAASATGVFVVTAADLYGPHWFFRLHALAEVLAGTGFIHLALVFPIDRIRGRERRVLTLLYGGSAVVIAVYEVVLYQPRGYTMAHLLATGGQVVGAGAMIAGIVHDFFTTRSALVRRRIGVVAVGAVAGLLLPVMLWASSTVLGGGISINAAAFTAFLFPLALAYAIVQRDLFEIDVVLRRAVTYTTVVGVTVVAYVGVLGAAGVLLGGSLASDRPVLLVALNVCFLFLLEPLRGQVQERLDQLFFRRGYDPQASVAALGRALEGARSVEQVVAATWATISGMFWPRELVLLAADARQRFHAVDGSTSGRVTIALPTSLVERLEADSLATRYEWDDGSGAEVPQVFEQLRVEVIVPIRHDGRLRHLLALGRKESGRAYGAPDAQVLRTMARQVSLARATASAFGELEELNAGLERQVAERTRELAVTNSELNHSLRELRSTYERLESNQQSLLRADRLATLGRLTAGLAHEVATPLGAVLHTLRVMGDLSSEYAESIDDPAVLPADHRAIATEMQEATRNATSYAEKAAEFVRRVKEHGREPGAGDVRRFAIKDVIEQVQGLLAHRLRASSCTLVFGESDAPLEVVGDPSRLGHVLLNVVQNAIEAYDEQHAREGRIEVAAHRVRDGVVITVRDFAGGIPAEIAERIFEELFTTKESGKGTGLGLWIARNVVEQRFAGELTLLPCDGPGACFRLLLRGDASSPDADDAVDAPRADALW